VGWNLWILSNDALPSLDGLSALASVASVGGSLRIESNDGLPSLDGLSALTSLGGDLRIDHNDNLTSLEGLSALTSMGEDLWVVNNVALPYCEICDFLAQLESPPPYDTVNGNLLDSCWSGSELTCP